MIYFISIVCISSVILAGLTDSILAKFFFLSFAALFTITVGAKYLYNLSLETLKNEQKRQRLIRSNNKSEENNKKKPENKYKSRIIEDENYKKLTQTIKYFSTNKVLDREQILDFKKQVDKKLGDHVKYYKNDWQNDFHELYSKLKSKKLKSEDYSELLKVLKSYNN